MSEKIVSFVMSGGVGSRLWPLSREDNPKQFHDLSGDGSMLAKTLRRLAARPAGATPIYLIASERHSRRVHADLGEIDVAGGGAIFEPVGRNTAAAVAIATLADAGRPWRCSDAGRSVRPRNLDRQAVLADGGGGRAGRARRADRGVRHQADASRRPATATSRLPAAAHVRDVSRFVEKPDLATAETYLASGNFYWNTGIFLFRAGAMRDAFKKFRPDIWQAAEAAFAAATGDLSGLYMPLDLYEAIPSTSIDYAIMEKAERIAMVPAGFRWNDLGSWQSLLDVSPADKNGNVIVGDVVAIDCENSYLRSDGSLLSAIGLKNVAIVSTPDATFVAPVSHSQNVKKIVEQLEKSGRLETRFTPAPDRVLVSGAWRRRVHHWLFDETLPLWSTKGVDDIHGGFHEALGFDGSPLLEAQAHAHHGAPGLRLRGRQGARLGRAGGPADRAWAGVHGAQRPHRARRLGAHAERRRQRRRSGRGRLRPFLRAAGARLGASLRQSGCAAARRGDVCVSRQASGGRRGRRLSGDADARGDAALQSAHASARGLPRLAFGDRRRGASAARRADHRAVQAAFLRRRKLDARRILRRELAAGSRRGRARGPSPATISNGPRCWSTSPGRAASRR